MNEFKGKKFYVKDDDVKRSFDIYGNIVEKPIFHMTRTYVAYLKEKEMLEKQQEIAKLKAKLEYEHQRYGEVDPVDFNRFMQMVNNR